jgi:hypothetical protein
MAGTVQSGKPPAPTRLRNGCPQLAEWWETHDIRGDAGGVKRLRRAKKGLLRLRTQVSRPMTILT